MRYFTPDEVCAFLEKEEHTKEDALIYNSPCFENPQLLGRPFGGFAQVPLRIPQSINIFVSPMGCARHCESGVALFGQENRFYRMTLNENEIINGDAEKKLCEEVDGLLENMAEDERPRVVTITITCIDGLLCTDYSRVERMLCEKYHVRFATVKMFPILGDNKRNHGDVLMESLYSLVQCPKERRKQKAVNLIGSSELIKRDSDFFEVLERAGFAIRQIHECNTLEEYDLLGEASLNVVINRHSVSAARQMKKNLGIPYIEFFECFYLEEISDNYKKLEEALGVRLDFQAYYDKTKQKLKEVLDKMKDRTWAVGGKVDYNPSKFIYDFIRTGFNVKYILADRFKKKEKIYYDWYRENRPDLKIYPAFDMEMMNFYVKPEPADFLIGADGYLFFMEPGMRPVDIGEEPFDFITFHRALERIEKVMEPEKEERTYSGERSVFDRKWMRWE